VLVVEDEPLPRRSLRRLIEETSGLDLVGEAKDGREAVRLIDALRPDLVLLDVELPELSGVEVLRRVRHRPAVVFTTAYDRYAVTAFELEAIDYLLKPYGRRRFAETMARVRRRLASTAPSAGAAADAPPPTPTEEGTLTRLFARVRDRLIPIPVADISRVEAQGDYVAVHHAGRSYLLAVSLSDLERRLDPSRFRRVHRSHLVNLDHVREMRAHDERRLVLRLADGSEVVASRTGSRWLREQAL
jgi:two-component system LytT family response regulator